MKICEPSKCTGCSVCADACPQKCISIRHDEQGFYRSYVEEDKCIHCHRCEKVCPANHPQKAFSINKAYKSYRKNVEAVASSTSGGIAGALSEHIFSKGGAVAGCGYDGALHLKHSIASSAKDLEAFKGSKYLQSDTVGIYQQVRQALQTGKTVLFTGTPCQVSALQSFLGKKYENLYTVDFVCHGVPSQYVFDRYLASLDATQPPVSIQFRNKTAGYRDKKSCSKMRVEYPEKTVQTSTESGVYYWFSSSLSIRESCYKCPFVSTKRSADITLADYIGDDISDIENQTGVSTVFINSNKGAMLFEAIKEHIVAKEINVPETVKKYTRLMIGAHQPQCRKAFFEDLFKMDYQALSEKYVASRVLPSKMMRRCYALKRRIRILFVR